MPGIIKDIMASELSSEAAQLLLRFPFLLNLLSIQLPIKL